MRAVSTAGERVAVDCRLPWLTSLLAGSTGGELSVASDDGATVRVGIQSRNDPFRRDGWTLVGRDTWASPRAVLIVDACSSGFDLRVEPCGEMLHVTARYRPSPRTRAANMLLPARFRLLAGQTLVHYPALWWASVHGRVPLHVCVTASAASVTMIAGPGGVGKSAMLLTGLKHREVATADNVCACDGHTAYGLAEPLRVAADARRATTTHGRIERQLPGRVTSLEPDRLVVLRRAAAGCRGGATPLAQPDAIRALVAGTYMAGELRRFWSFAATLALATGAGPAHPDVTGVAAVLAARLPCFEVSVVDGSPEPLGELLSPAGAL